MYAQSNFNDVIETPDINSPEFYGELKNPDFQYLNSSGDHFYSEDYYLPGFDGNILASVEHNGEHYVAGWFLTHNGGKRLNSVAKWNGAEWEPVGEGFSATLEGDRATVRALASLNGELYAGGSFFFSGDEAVSGIAKWDGSQWQQVGDGVNGIVYDIIEFDDTIYIGGSFFSSGDQAVNNIARWNGEAWETVVNGLDSTVNTLKVWNGKLVAGGFFENEMPEPLDQDLFVGEYIIEQENPDGSLDSFGSPEVFNGELVTNVTLNVDANQPQHIRQFEAVLYASMFPDNLRTINLSFFTEQNFVTVSENTSTGIGCSAISVSLGVDNDPENSGFNPSDDSSFQFSLIENVDEDCDLEAVQHTFTATRVNDTSQFASGNNVQSLNRIAVYDGSSWSPLGDGFDGQVTSLSVYDDQLVAGGFFMESAGVGLNSVSVWTGDEWAPLGNGFNGPVQGLQVIGSLLYAAGQFNQTGSTTVPSIASWDGNEWASVGDHEPAIIFHINEIDNSLFAAIGSFNAGNLIEASLLDNNSWNSLGAPDASGAGVAGQIAGIAKSGTTIYAAGNFLRAGINPANRTAKWTPQNGWEELGSGLDNFVRRLTLHDDLLIAGGNFFANGAGTPMTHIAYYDGTDWAQLGSGLNRTIQRFLEYDDNLVIAGNFLASGPNEVSGVTLWDGEEFQRMGYEIVNAGYGLAELDGNLYLSGFNLMGNNEKIAVWIHGEWIEVPLDGFIENANNVWSLGVHDGKLYAAVEYIIDGNAENRILGLIDSEWEQIGESMTGGPVFDVISHDGQLYVGGFFTRVGNEPMRSPIIWDDGEWVSAGGGINGVMHSFISTPRGLFIGGSYQMAGNTPSASLAKWITDEEAVSTEPPVAELPQQVRLNQNYPNPFNPTTTISFDLPSASDVRIDIYDLLGRKVATLLNDYITAGSHEVRFDASALSSGMYIYRLNTADAVITRNMMLIK